MFQLSILGVLAYASPRADERPRLGAPGGVLRLRGIRAFPAGIPAISVNLMVSALQLVNREQKTENGE